MINYYASHLYIFSSQLFDMTITCIHVVTYYVYKQWKHAMRYMSAHSEYFNFINILNGHKKGTIVMYISIKQPNITNRSIKTWCLQCQYIKYHKSCVNNEITPLNAINAHLIIDLLDKIQYIFRGEISKSGDRQWFWGCKNLEID